MKQHAIMVRKLHGTQIYPYPRCIRSPEITNPAHKSELPPRPSELLVSASKRLLSYEAFPVCIRIPAGVLVCTGMATGKLAATATGVRRAQGSSFRQPARHPSG